MKKTLLIILAGVMALTFAFAFAGCGEMEPKTLEEYVNSDPSAKEGIDNAVRALEDDDMTVEVAYDRNTIVVTGTMKTTYADDLIESVRVKCQETGEQIEPQAAEMITELEEVIGSDDVGMEVIINNGDGTEIWRNSYTN